MRPRRAIAHGAGDRLHAEEQALGVHPVDPVPVGFGDVEEAEALGHAGIVDQDVHAPVPLHHRGHDGLDVAQVAHIALDEVAAGVGHGGCTPLGIDVDAHHRRPLRRAAQGDRPSHACAHAGHDRYAVLEQHLAPPASVGRTVAVARVRMRGSQSGYTTHPGAGQSETPS